MSKKEFQDLSFQNIAGAKCAILAGWDPYRSYKGGVAGEVEGVKVRTIAFANGFDTLEVKMPGVFSLDVSNEELDTMARQGTFIYATFKGLELRHYTRDNNIYRIITAKEIQILGTDRGKA